MLRPRWAIPTVKINGKDPNPARWSDGVYSVHGTATLLGITPQTVFKWIRKGHLKGRQLKKGMPWQIDIADDQIEHLKSKVYPRMVNSTRPLAGRTLSLLYLYH